MNILKNKKLITIIAAIVLVIIIGLVLLFTLGGNNDKDKKGKDLPIEEKVTNGTAKKQGNFELTDLKISSKGALNVVTGKVKNTAKAKKSVELKLLMSNSEKAQLLGSSVTIVENIEPGKSKEFEVSLVGSYNNIDTYEVRASDYIKTNVKTTSKVKDTTTKTETE